MLSSLSSVPCHPLPSEQGLRDGALVTGGIHAFKTFPQTEASTVKLVCVSPPLLSLELTPMTSQACTWAPILPFPAGYGELLGPPDMLATGGAVGKQSWWEVSESDVLG